MDAITERITVGIVLVAAIVGVVILGVTNDSSITLVFASITLILTTGLSYLRTGKVSEKADKAVEQLEAVSQKVERVEQQTNGNTHNLIQRVIPVEGSAEHSRQTEARKVSE